MGALQLGTIMSIANMVLRALHEAPELVDAIEKFWRTVTGNPGAPDHIEAAVTAAIASIKATAAP